MVLLHAAFLALLVGTEAFFTGLSWWNLRHGARRVREEADWLADVLDVDDPGEVVAYQRARARLGWVEQWTMLGLVLSALFGGLLGRGVAWAEGWGLGPVATGVVLLALLGVLVGLVHLPFSAAATFRIEERFGFNRQDLTGWARDRALGMGLGLGLATAVFAGLLWLVGTLPATWWIAATGLYVVLAVVMQVVGPRWIAPLFHDFEPLEAGPLREAVEEVCERAGVACRDIYVMDASRRSSHSNAFFAGFGRTKRIVLFDTLVEQMDVEQVQAVLAHEIAHWRRAHIWKRLAGATVETGVVLAVLAWAITQPALFAMFGVPATTYAGLLIGGVWLSPLGRWLAPVSNALSQRHEREADDFAVDVMQGPEPMVGALARLAGENLENPFPHPLHAVFHATHPPMPERMRRLRAALRE